MSTLQSLIHELQVVLIHLTASHYCVVSSASLYVYDFFLTFPQEVEYFWNTPWTFVKGIFFWNRYSTFALLYGLVSLETNRKPTPTSCFALDVFEGLCAIANIAGAQVIMQRRVHALYGQHQVLKIVLHVLFILEILSVLGIEIANLVKNDDTALVQMIPLLSDPLTICSGAIPRFFIFFPVPYMIFDTILLSLVMYKAYLIQTEEPDKKWTSTRLMQIMFRDSVLYFACTFGVNLLNTLVWVLGPFELFTVGTAWAVTVPVMAANRLLFNMRSAYHEEPKTSELNVESIEFQTARRQGGTSSGLTGWSNSSGNEESNTQESSN
ncbi:hypothetical protein FB45DRAFT_955400 [Roridomyces roridus]|uniref:DUF6533 domain-containing protein n=1 Tax=Roridomyces roridus TaxID=1738132 RepID=A0AAD7F8C4_9AGAR|nr:hypothetical protein FB45DRAFT_955400 [Roridomyces roridus]